MKIREGLKEDYSYCIRIAEELPDYFNKTGIAELTKDLEKHKLFVIEDNKEILGFITLDIKNSIIAEISWLAIDKNKQRKGLGALILTYAVQFLKNNGISILEVKTLSRVCDYEPYKKNRNFYEKSGFSLLESNIFLPHWGQDNPCDIYIKTL